MKTVVINIWLLASGLLAASANAVYLNVDNIDVEIGPNSTYTSSNNTFSGGATIDKVIDAPSADAAEFHNQTTHNWFSGGNLELLFDFRTQYDLTTLHFWNYTGEGFDVDNIEFTFFDSSNALQGSLSVTPALGNPGGILAEDIVLLAPLDVQFVTAVLSGSNGEVDFQNLGFTASLSTDRCLTNPNDPICFNNPPTAGVPEPETIGLFVLAFVGLNLARRRKIKA